MSESVWVRDAKVWTMSSRCQKYNYVSLCASDKDRERVVRVELKDPAVIEALIRELEGRLRWLVDIGEENE